MSNAVEDRLILAAMYWSLNKKESYTRFRLNFKHLQELKYNLGSKLHINERGNPFLWLWPAGGLEIISE